jgi:PhnB protein
MVSANVYLNFDGNCEEAFNFYKKVFGVELAHISYFKDMPPQEGQAASEIDGNRVMHVSISLGNGTALMGSDTGGDWSLSYVQGNNFSISLNAGSKEEADNVFNALADGGAITMPLASTFWGDYFGMCTDRFGVNWMMSFNEKTYDKA